jgi:hypothetical protein
MKEDGHVIPELRERFNSSFTEEKYQKFLQSLESSVGARIEFRPCETPVFLPNDLFDGMSRAANEIITQLCTPESRTAAARAIPADFNVPHESANPHFIQVDFAVTKDRDGNFAPKLIELQGFASLYAFQLLLPQVYQQVYELSALEYLPSGISVESYVDLLRKIILKDHAPEQVILMEIDPLHQKTRPDFLFNQKLLGVPTVAVTDVIKHGNKLFYQDHGREIEIRRIYNRVIIDELIRKEVRINFDFRDDLDVEWAGHPNWYFRMSKFSLPFIKHRTVPRAWFLNQLTDYPEDLENFVLKPLFSFAGSGVKVNITREVLSAVPADKRADYLLQEKVEYAPVIKTLNDPSRVEVRVMFVWPEDAVAPLAVNTLTRLSQGEMMGVDFNKNKTWVGSSCAFFPPRG